MSALIPELVIAGLGASVSPVAVMVLISLMFRKRPLRNALFFLAGYTLVLIALGIAGLLLLHASGSGTRSALDAWLDTALGALCLAAIPLAFRKKKGTEDGEEPGELKASRAVLIGMGTMAVNTSTIVIFLSGVHTIAKAKPGVPEDVAALAILIAVTLVTLLVPVVLYAAFPETGQKVLTAVRAWLNRHSALIGAVILTVFGVYLLVKGILELT